MANVLLVDPSETARAALRGILDRGGHRFAAVDTATTAWDFLRANPTVDLVFLEIHLAGDTGLRFAQRVRADPVLKQLPIVIYTDAGERTAVKICLDLHVQNFLVKPYDDETVFAEVAKADANPWRNQLFEEEKSFCRLINCTPVELHQLLAQVQTEATALLPVLERWAPLHSLKLPQEIRELSETAEAAGAWAVVEAINQIQEIAQNEAWLKLDDAFADFAFAAELIRHRLDPELVTAGFLAEELSSEESNGELDLWLNAPAEDRAPVMPWDTLVQQVEALPGCPIIDTGAAAFRMAATGHPSCINPLMDLVARDPGLSAQMLIAANRARGAAADAFSCIEDARLAVGQLGEKRLAAQAGNLITVAQDVMRLGTHFNWPQFWIFQRGVARVAQQICGDLELYSMEATARTAGELHDIGKLLLARIQPLGFRAIVTYSHRHHLPLPEVETLLLGGTTTQLAACFADRIGLSQRFANVMRWLDEPAAATADQRLVAVVALARDLCQDFHVGTSGEWPRETPRAIEESAAWEVLKDCVYPSFNVAEFEERIHAVCRKLRTEFTGNLASHPSRVA